MGSERRARCAFPLSWMIAVASASIVAQIAGLATFPHGNPQLTLVRALLVAAVFLTPLSLIARKFGHPIVAETIFFLRAIVVFVSGIPLGNDRWTEFMMLCSLIIEGAALHAVWTGLSIVCFLSSIDILLQGTHRAWGMPVAAVPIASLIASALGYALTCSAVLSCSVLLRRLARVEDERTRLALAVERLAGAGEDFLSYARSARRESAEDERNRLTREVHDVVGYTLTNIRMMMEAGIRRKDMDRQELDRLLSWTLEQAQRGLQEIRSILRLIRAGGEAERRGVAAIAEAVNVFQTSTGTSVSLDWGNMTDRWIEGDRDRLALRLVQEGLINAFRHGLARHVELAFFQDAESIHLSIQDDGNGTDTVKKGIGLSGMEERVRSVGGSLLISPIRPGFRIVAALPFSIGEKETE